MNTQKLVILFNSMQKFNLGLKTMTELFPFLKQIDINTAGMNVLAWVIVLSIIYFFFFKFWPYYTKERWPRMQLQNEKRMEGELEIEKHRNDVLQGIKENLIRLTTLVEANIRLTESHDSFTKEIWSETSLAINDLRINKTLKQVDSSGLIITPPQNIPIASVPLPPLPNKDIVGVITNGS